MPSASPVKMAKVSKPVSSSRPGRQKGGTVSTRNHRFESFSQRIAKITIDPVRRVRRHDLDDADLSATASYFKASLEEWKDLNLSDHFTLFARKVSPCTDSLAQILHYQDRIMDLMMDYTEKGDQLSLEPLLSLLAHFAHDLGVRFERHFGRAVQTVALVAAKNQAVEVVEWSFTCLAWLFKYLSRLLVPDLRPLYGLMAPLLGKESQKPFVTRFAAEAMSFLIRKAAIAYGKDPEPLQNILVHIFRDLGDTASEKNFGQYQQGLMMLFSDAIKGINRGIHSSGDVLFNCMVLTFLDEDNGITSAAEEAICGVLISLIHHTEAETFNPIMDVVLEHVQTNMQKKNPSTVQFRARMLFIVVGVRKGSRVQSWEPLLQCAEVLLGELQELEDTSAAAESVLKATAIILQSSPLDLVLPHLRGFVQRITNERLTSHFLPFCNYFFELGAERFRDLMLPEFQKFVVAQWQSEEKSLCFLIPKLYQAGGLAASGSNKQSISCPDSWQIKILQTFEAMAKEASTGHSSTDDAIIMCANYLRLFDAVTLNASAKESILRTLNDLIKDCLMRSSDYSQEVRNFSVGSAMLYYVQEKGAKVFDRSIWPALSNSTSEYGSLPSFLKAVIAIIKHIGPLSQADLAGGPLLDALNKNLSSPSHDLRLLSLQLYEIIYESMKSHRSDTISTALLIEETPFNFQTSRTLSMHVRNLAAGFTRSEADSETDKWLADAVISYCFGLLTVRSSQLWEDSCNALKEIAESKRGDKFVSHLALQWLQVSPESVDSSPETENSEDRRQNLTDFQCSNIISLEKTVSRCLIEIIDSDAHLLQEFEKEIQPQLRTPPIARSQALRLLGHIPQIAEKNSRQIIPFFLQWAARNDESNQESLTPEITFTEGDGLRWTRKDVKDMLNVFAQFNNPKVLYKSADVYSALLDLLTNGDNDIQKLALKSIFTWKSPSIRPYEENLLNILDDARFRDEISVFLHRDDDETSIRPEHRSDLLPVLLRLLYGKSVSRRGSTAGGQEAKRKAVLDVLGRFTTEEIGLYVSIALGPMASITLIESGHLNKDIIEKEVISPRKQVGMLRMVQDMLESIATQLKPFTSTLLHAVLYSLIRASRIISEAAQMSDGDVAEEAHLKLSKTIRQLGYRCLNLLFMRAPEVDWTPYIPTVFQELLDQRIERLAQETSQSVSGLMQIFSTWSSNSELILFLGSQNQTLLPKIAECISIPTGKEEVKLFVLENIVKNMIKQASEENEKQDNRQIMTHVAENLIRPNVDHFLVHTGEVLHGSPSKELLTSAVETVTQLVPFVSTSSNARNLVEVSVFLLEQPTHRVSPKTKSDLLRILEHFIPLHDLKSDKSLWSKSFSVASSLFGYFKDQTSREVLSQVMLVLAGNDEELRQSAELCQDLNSFLPNRLDEPDFDRRLKAFRSINETWYNKFNEMQWQPLLYNMLYFVKDQEELAIRANASYSLRRFVDTASGGIEDKAAFRDSLTSILLPAIRLGAREPSELVRTEYITVMAHIVKQFPDWEAVSDMHPLLMGEDEEASFFNNILHIQHHRRLRALRRLADASSSGQLCASNVSHFFIPLIEHYIFDKADDDSAHNLSAETVKTIGMLAESLEWPQYKAVFRRFNGYMTSKPDLEKTVIRLLGTVVDALSRAVGKKESPTSATQPSSDAMDIEETSPQSTQPIPTITLAKTTPKEEKLSVELTNNFLPSLVAYLHEKDENVVSLRVPVAISVVKLLRLLPFDQMSARLPAVLTDISHILRSRTAESRDLTRKTLSQIAALLGPSCFGFILKELRSALTRGYQLHVLSFTVHSILVEGTPFYKPGDLDYCTADLVAVIMDDIFGVTGQEKDAEDYISKMKEVKSSKSFDSMELLAKTTTLRNLGKLIHPIQVLLQEKLDLKTVKKIDELLRRIGSGVTRNEAVSGRDFLVFCYEVVQDVYKASSREPQAQKKDEYRIKRYLIEMKGANKSGARGSTTSYTFKLVRFSLDVLRAVLHKHDSLQTSSNLAGFLPIIGDALVQGQEEVQISALRLLTTIIRVPLGEIDENGPTYITEAVKVIKACPSTNAEIAQAALKLISAILRDRRNVEVRDTHVAYLLKRLKPDLDEPDRQGVTFNFLKSVLARKMVIPEVYEILDTVAEIMVTNQTRGSRDLARGVYFTFFMEYPQGKDRLTKQLTFLTKNLEYQYQEGRKSVLEAIHLLVSKVGGELLQELISTFFVPLVMVLINDESPDCREMASVLIKACFEQADSERMQSFIRLLRTWLTQDEQAMLIRVSLQCYGLYFDAQGSKGEKELGTVQKRVLDILVTNDPKSNSSDWELVYYSLQLISKLCQLFPDAMFAGSLSSLWEAVRSCLVFPHAWVKISASKLLGLYFADFARSHAQTGLEKVPLIGSRGLRLDSSGMLQLTKASLSILKYPGVSEELATQSVRNLLFLGRCLGANGLLWESAPQANSTTELEEDDDSEDDEQRSVIEEISPSTEAKSALQYLFERVSTIIRREPASTRAPALVSKTTSLQFVAALSNTLPEQALVPSLPTILLPLHNLTDTSIPAPTSSDPAFTVGYKELQSTSQEILSLLQKKLGTTLFVQEMTKVREGVKARREGRRVKRRIEAIREPEKVGREKRRKMERKKERRQEKSVGERGKRRGW